MIDLGYTTVHKPKLFRRLAAHCSLKGIIAGAASAVLFGITGFGLVSGRKAALLFSLAGFC
jgi:hypothetical protein